MNNFELIVIITSIVIHIIIVSFLTNNNIIKHLAVFNF